MNTPLTYYLGVNPFGAFEASTGANLYETLASLPASGLTHFASDWSPTALTSANANSRLGRQGGRKERKEKGRMANGLWVRVGKTMEEMRKTSRGGKKIKGGGKVSQFRKILYVVYHRQSVIVSQSNNQS